MDFDFSPEQTALRQEVIDALVPEERAGLAALGDLDTAQLKEALLAWAGRLGPGGFFESGGVALCLAREALAAASPSLLLGLSSGHLLARLAERHGSAGQKELLLPELCSGKALGAVATGEGGTSLGPGPLETTAKLDGDNFVLNGAKGQVLGGPLASWLAVAAQSDEGLAWCLLPADSPGLNLGQRLPTLGLEGAAICGLTLQESRVPRDMVMGPFRDRESLEAIKAWEDEVLVAISLGVTRTALDTALAYAKKHKAGGKPIIAYQEIGFKLAEMFTLYQSAQLLAYKAAWAEEAGRRDADEVLGCAKVFCAESAGTVASEALQVLGGAGFVRGNPAERAYRDAKYLSVAGVSSEISRMNLGEAVLAAH